MPLHGKHMYGLTTHTFSTTISKEVDLPNLLNDVTFHRALQPNQCASLNS